MNPRLKNYDWPQGRYSSDEGEISSNLVLPMLKHAMRYDRSVGYLKKSHFSDIGLDLVEFVEKGGHARFLFGEPLERELLLACEQAIGDSDLEQEVEIKLRDLLASADPHNGGPDLAATLIQYLVSADAADFRLVLRQNGMHHEKVRIAYDHVGDVVVTVGSDNDSASALSGRNRESGTLICSWSYPETDYWATHGAGYLDEFERLWENENEESITIALSDQVRLGIQQDWLSRDMSYEDLKSLLTRQNKEQSEGARQLRDFQEDAIEKWQDNGYEGVMALCTGAGKTFTTVKAAEMLDDYFREESESFALVVAVPYQILAHQWVAELSEIFDQVISCWSENNEWREELKAAAFGTFNEHTGRSSFAVVVVNDTFLKDDFQTLLGVIPNQRLMFVGDEVHRHGTPTFAGKIPKARFRLGLSATPWSSGEEDRESIIKLSYGEVVKEFGIKDAIEEHVLCPYHYQVVSLELSEQEAFVYKELASSISQLVAQVQNGGTASDERELRQLLARRNSILGTCDAKIEWLARFAASKKAKQTLIYCSEGKAQSDGEYGDQRALNRIAEIFHSAGWNLGKITAEESFAKRSLILEDFQRGHIDGIAAIRVLDEGFDLPMCRAAFLLSSSRNERQFIQRRGRVLRMAPGKSEATIYDFLVLPGRDFAGEQWASGLVEGELIRAWEFSRFSLEATALEQKLGGLAKLYDVDFAALRNTVEERSYGSEDLD